MNTPPKRSDTVKLLKKYLRKSKEDLVEPRDDDYITRTVGNEVIKLRENMPHHWGFVELRAFMDALYGGPPQSEDEYL